MKTFWLSFFLICIGIIGQCQQPIGRDSMKTSLKLDFTRRPTIKWISPKPEILESVASQFNIQLEITTEGHPQEEHFRIFIDDELCLNNDKSTPLTTPETTEKTTFEAKIDLRDSVLSRGQHKIVLEVLENGKWFPSEPVWVKVRKPKLFLLSIGPKYDDLQFSKKDAEDFANLFEKKIPLYSEIEITKLLGYRASWGNIIGEITRLEQLQASNEISEDDVVILFISAHGFVGLGDGDNDFRIQPADYREETQSLRKLTSVSYKTNISEPFENIHCHKVIFLDACHSGAAETLATKGTKNNGSQEKILSAIDGIFKTQKGLAVIASSSPSQKSFEYGAKEHGVFTAALLEIMEQDSLETVSLDMIMNHLSERVPQLGRDCPECKIQTPVWVRNELYNMVIYAHPKEE